MHICFLSSSPSPSPPVPRSHTPAHKRHLHPWPRCEKLVHPEVELSQIRRSHQRWESGPGVRVRLASVRGCHNTWGVMNRRGLTLGPRWPVHTNGPFNPRPLLSALTASVYSQSPAIRVKIHYIPLCLLFMHLPVSSSSSSSSAILFLLFPSLPLSHKHPVDFWSWIFTCMLSRWSISLKIFTSLNSLSHLKA